MQLNKKQSFKKASTSIGVYYYFAVKFFLGILIVKADFIMVVISLGDLINRFDYSQ